ncbi:alpha/beta-Hydrolase [Glarea lozoyensis ATCC 20868]|uniref:Alpha/beta-Hydrolase n=2 Tax=Glarea lozoyensis TaxID=101852 RepID=S3CLL1_GLAL2|nr:alpha/beta-Hydrolase [Glarea lozoyensis ATCC 20868]EHL00331.1 putative Fluoroacetate dehalogenase [Glarea lozoyensis 74030]EPE27367.1 alpha/beta-Hydrolase [Glarea lozoyensis ATCC 20868]
MVDIPWDKSCITASTDDVDYMTSLGLKSNLKTTAEEKLFYYSRGLEDVKPDTPVLVLLHGYPQTWRHIIPLLPKSIPLFIPDLCGYGRSSPLTTAHNKLAVGRTLLSTLHSILPSGSTPQSLILCGHDRGARIAHRLTVSARSLPNFTITGTILLDIMPTLSQWASGSTPSKSVGFYHWSFLPNVSLATEMILALGGPRYVESCIQRWAGSGIQTLEQHNAMSVYGRAFSYEHVIRASCEDYRASAFEEVEEHEGDQRDGRKMEGRVVVGYSKGFLGQRGRVEEWGQWVGEGGRLDFRGFEGGHFVAEECPEEVAEMIGEFYGGV